MLLKNKRSLFYWLEKMLSKNQKLFDKCRNIYNDIFPTNAINLYLVLSGARRSAILESYSEFDRGGNKIEKLFKSELDKLFDDYDKWTVEDENLYDGIKRYSNCSLSNEVYTFLINLNDLCHEYGCETYHDSPEILVTRCKDKLRLKKYILQDYHEDTYENFINLAYLLEYPIVSEKEFKMIKSHKIYRGNFRLIIINRLRINFNYFNEEQLRNTVSVSKINKVMKGLIVAGKQIEEVKALDICNTDLYACSIYRNQKI